MADSDAVAIYWDFENIHAAVIDATRGQGHYRSNRFMKQDPEVDVGAIVAFAASLGRVAINRAYGNWQWMASYRDVLQEHAMDLIQLFPLGKAAKNGADIRLALDAIDDLTRYGDLTHMVLVTGDSDFIGLAQAVRRRGCQVIGVGVEAATNSRWATACDQFMYYRSLLARGGQAATGTDGADVADVADARRLLAQALQQLSPRSSVSPWVVKAAIKPMMLRLDPTFDETAYGYRSFSELLDTCDDILDSRVGAHDHEYRLRDAAEIGAPRGPEPTYERILRQSGWRLVDRSTMWAVLAAIGDILPDRVVKDFAELDDLVLRHLEQQGAPTSMLDAKKARQVAFKCRLFGSEEAGFVQLLVPPPEIRRAVVTTALRRIDEQSVDEIVDPEQLAAVLFGNPTDGDRALIADCMGALVDSEEPAAPLPGPPDSPA